MDRMPTRMVGLMMMGGSTHIHSGRGG